jgi:hypothetical protein
VQQQQAVMSEIRSEQHLSWKTLPLAGRIKDLATLVRRTIRRQVLAAEMGSAVNAPFVGNSTFITNPNGNLLALQRQSDCSLSLLDASWFAATSAMATTMQLSQTTAHYELTLHSEAQLTTSADVFPNGCVDPTSGFSTRVGVNLGKTAQGQNLVAWALFGDA